jgi:hypothetical protein
MLHRLRRHPFPVVAQFERCLVVTYALPQEALTPLLVPGLTLDTHRGYGFVAIALVQTRKLRPAGWPAMLGQDFFLSGYRIFTRFETTAGRVLRGLQILRSDTDRRRMALMGNLLTHYNYQHARVELTDDDRRLEIRIHTPDRAADLVVIADRESPVLPDGSVYTFDYEPETRSIVMIRGVRSNWMPRLVQAQVRKCTFFEHGPLSCVKPILSSAFYMSDIPYRWERGRCEALNGVRP